MLLRVILVEPREAGNVGAAARAMKNFGFHDLWIVGPRPQREDAISAWWAKGADDLIEAAHRVGTLDEALTDCHLSIATTAVRGRDVRDVLDPTAAAELANQRLAEDQVLAVVFGREESGLTQAEIALCERTATIPTDPLFPTMNLAQAVSLFCWEMHKLRVGGQPPLAREEQLPPIALLRHLRARSTVLLDRVGFLEERSARRVMNELNAITRRAGLNRREASLLLAVVRRLERAVGTERR